MSLEGVGDALLGFSEVVWSSLVRGYDLQRLLSNIPVYYVALAGATSGLRSLPGSFSSASTQAAPGSPSCVGASSTTYSSNSSNSSSSRGGAGVRSLAGSTEEAGGPLDRGSGMQQQAAAASSNAGQLQSLDDETVRWVLTVVCVTVPGWAGCPGVPQPNGAHGSADEELASTCYTPPMGRG